MKFTEIKCKTIENLDQKGGTKIRPRISGLLFMISLITLSMILGTGVSAAGALTVSEATYQMPVIGPVGQCNNCHDPSTHPVNNCTACHDNAKYEPDSRLLGGHGGLVTGDYTASTGPVGNCQQCHMYNETGWDLCGNCHVSFYSLPPTPPTPNPAAPWALGYSHDYTRINNFSGHDRVYNCEDCHVQSYWPSIPGHDTTIFGSAASHESTLAIDCAECHYSSLTTEHAQPGRTDPAGNQVNCLTCHASSNSGVKEAIAARNAQCGSCHTGSHTEQHTVNLGAGCQASACHAGDLITDHEKFNISCADCHSSPIASIKQAVDNRNRNCGACHYKAHNTIVLSRLPADITLYPELDWTSPMPLSVWKGEPWVDFEPEGYMIMVSGRRSLSWDAVWQFYDSSMQQAGWTLESQPPAQGSGFSAVFSKSGRKAVIWFYGAEDRSDTGTLSTGSRIELIYQP